MAADSNRSVTTRADGGRGAPGERQAAALERIASAVESVDLRLGELAGALEQYRPAIDRAARLAGGPAGKAASVLGALGGRRG